MAIRNIRTIGDNVLTKKAKEITVVDDRLTMLIQDMLDTMYEADGVGLAAPQIGILKRIVVIDVGNGLFEMINPEILEKSGEQDGMEGCLSVPGLSGEVKRPMNVTVRYTDRKGQVITIDTEGIFARCVCHELDHLDGILFKDKAHKIYNNKDLEG